MVLAPTKKGNTPPIKRPITTIGSVRSITVIPAAAEKAEKRAKAVRAAEPMAKPLPMAAVVLPIESSLSVMALVDLGNPDISAIPPALSEIGP